MVNFTPPQLRTELASAMVTWNRMLQWKLPAGLPESDSENEGSVITPDSPIELSLPDGGVSYETNVSTFIGLMKELEVATLIDLSECRTPERILVRVEATNERAQKLFRWALPEPTTEAEIKERAEIIARQNALVELDEKLPRYREGMQPSEFEAIDTARKPYDDEYNALVEVKNAFAQPTQRYFPVTLHTEGSPSVSLTRGLTVFELLVQSAWFDFMPRFRPHEYFVEVRHSQPIAFDKTRNIVKAYLFELASSLGIEFTVAPLTEFCVPDEGKLFAIAEHHRLRPLMIGKGMSDLLELYSRGAATTDPEFQILYFTKTVEYVAQTVIHQQAIQKIRAKLLTPQALAPDATFITELKNIVSKNERAAENDREAIKQTILHCCDATELAKDAPEFLAEFRSRKLASDLNAQKTALSKFAQSLYDTRNLIAHAKSNYKATGNECPSHSLKQFASCAQVAAQQVIRWFHSTPEDVRAVEND